MITEAEFEQFKEEVKRESIKRARKTATIFGVLAMTAMVALVYAFFQQAAAVRSRSMAENLAVEALEQKESRRELEVKVQKLSEELEKKAKMAEAAMQEASRQHQIVEKMTANKRARP